MLVLLLSAYVGLVGLDPSRPLERRQVTDGAGAADTVHHEPYRLVADSEDAVQLRCGDPRRLTANLYIVVTHFMRDCFESFMTETDLIVDLLSYSLHLCIIAEARSGLVTAPGTGPVRRNLQRTLASAEARP